MSFTALDSVIPSAFPVAHGTGIGDLLDAVVEKLPEHEEEDYDEDVIRVALIGRPNVGKSSLVNAILGEERVIVSELRERPGMRSIRLLNGMASVVLIDTAGMRKRGKVYETRRNTA